jgi:mono/diheme cytochrome c family protein
MPRLGAPIPVQDRRQAAGGARGGSLVIDRGAFVAYAADTDNRALHRVDLVSAGVVTTELGCVPEQIVLLGGDRIAVTLRDCNQVAVVSIDPTGAGTVTMVANVPSDPWGLAVTPGGELLVTSAWGRAVTALDANTLARRWSVGVAREPRSITVSPDGARAYVTHLVGDSLTILDLASGEEPAVRRVSALGGAYRNRFDRAVAAGTLHPSSALAYASVLSPSGSRLFIPHVLEQNGTKAAIVSPGSYGGVAVEEETSTASVAVLVTSTEHVLGARPEPGGAGAGQAGPDGKVADPIDRTVPIHVNQFVPSSVAPPVAPSRQARAAAVLDDALLVASMGTGEVVELDAKSFDPAMSVRRKFSVGEGPTGIDVEPSTRIAVTWNQFSHSAAIISLGSGHVETIPVAADPLPSDVAAGRRLFFTETDRRISRDGRACGGCHPDGRDDGLVWMLGQGPRQTPTLVGRLDSGPFGWQAKHAVLEENMRETMTRLGGTGLAEENLHDLAAFVRQLAAPNRTGERSSAQAVARGRELFVSQEVGCSGCHTEEHEASDRTLHDVGSRAPTDQVAQFRTPPLLFIAGTGPYFHDGRYATLEDLLADNLDRMGTTTHLSQDDRDALAAYLRTL